MKTTLLIMAVGIGSRFGTGIKQLEPVDYAFQDINDIPGTLPEGRTKPWGNWSGRACSEEGHQDPVHRHQCR